MNKKVQFGRFTLQGFGPNYNLPKLKYKTLIYLSKNSKLGARLRNGKVLGTHSAQTESSLLNSNDQYTFFCMILNDMLNIHDRRLTKINLNKFMSFNLYLTCSEYIIHDMHKKVH